MTKVPKLSLRRDEFYGEYEDFVLASDYDALAARVARLEDGLSEALGIVEQRYPDSAALLRREYLPDADGGKHG